MCLYDLPISKRARSLFLRFMFHDIVLIIPKRSVCVITACSKLNGFFMRTTVSLSGLIMSSISSGIRLYVMISLSPIEESIFLVSFFTLYSLFINKVFPTMPGMVCGILL